MRFCPRCGSLMVVRRAGDQPYWVCPSCGYSELPSEPQNATIVEKIRHSEKERIIVVNRAEELQTLPRTSAQCPKCGYGEAYYWLMQTRRADEPPTRFFKCVRCGHVWREYD